MANITKTSIMQLLTTPSASFSGTADEWQAKVVGRALVAIFKRQTRDERSSNATSQQNNIGFAGCDAKAGSITAKYYIKNGTLLDWQVAKWIAPSSTGYARIAKYHRQLNEIAAENAA